MLQGVNCCCSRVLVLASGLAKMVVVASLGPDEPGEPGEPGAQVSEWLLMRRDIQQVRHDAASLRAGQTAITDDTARLKAAIDLVKTDTGRVKSQLDQLASVSYTHLTLPTNREV